MIVSAQLGTGHNAHGGAGVDIFWNATHGDCQLRQTVSFIFRKIQFVISVEESLFVPMYKNAEWTMFIYIFSKVTGVLSQITNGSRTLWAS